MELLFLLAKLYSHKMFQEDALLLSGVMSIREPNVKQRAKCQSESQMSNREPNVKPRARVKENTLKVTFLKNSFFCFVSKI